MRIAGSPVRAALFSGGRRGPGPRGSSKHRRMLAFGINQGARPLSPEAKDGVR